ncbi:MAG TPA: phage tail sheath C-terminal domain-containing protein [Frankiaceae bacterium]|nr:phage tail sheath C-terminal domain-containing protein [Frankiaceae bacterium]
MPTYLSPGVFVEEMPSASKPIEGVGTAVAAFVGFAGIGPFDTPVKVTNWSQFTKTFGYYVDGAYLAHAVFGFFLNGGGECYVVRVGADAAPALDAPATADDTKDTAALKPAGAQAALPAGTVGAFTVTARGDAAGPVVLEVRPDDPPAPDTFTLLVKQGGRVVDTLTGLSVRPDAERYAPTYVTEQSTLVTMVATPDAEVAKPPPLGEVVLAAPPPVPALPPETVTASMYIGDSSARTGMGGLETIDEITMLCVPDLMSAYERGAVDPTGVNAVQKAMVAHCEGMQDRMAILDPLPGLDAQGIYTFWDGVAGSKYATLYWPWIKTLDPLSDKVRAMPPSGHIAGIWGRSDDTRGVHKAPANEPIRGAVDVEWTTTTGEQNTLNPLGVNCIRPFPGRGPVVWGARTLATKNEPDWKYVNVRRLFNFLEESIAGGTQWCVFEPNDEALWARIRRSISAFLVMQWRAGALFGSTPGEAFYVKCDGENNTAESIDAGQVICEIGVAPVKPAEFVIFRLSQFSGGASLTE